MAYIKTVTGNTTPNFLDSEVGLVLKTTQVDGTGITADEYGYKIVKAGTIVPANGATAEGIIFEDVDVTHGERAASKIVAGRIIADRLPAAPTAAAVTALQKSGIVFVGTLPEEETEQGGEN